MHNKWHQAENQYYAPFVLLAKAQKLTQNTLRTAFSCAERYIFGVNIWCQ